MHCQIILFLSGVDPADHLGQSQLLTFTSAAQRLTCSWHCEW